MSAEAVIIAAQWFFLAYFIMLNAGYLALNALAFVAISRTVVAKEAPGLPGAQSDLWPPVSLLVPCYNEQATIVASVRSLLQLEYPEFEIVVINDGSRDGTLAELELEFGLVAFPEAYRLRIPCRPVRTIYRSTRAPNLRVIDKENGGKADALNAGINAARYPVFCSMDADSVLSRDSLARVVEPFLEDADTVAAGGTVRIANGCKVEDGFLVEPRLPRNPLALVQVVEYLRAFLFGRLGWSPINALLIVSGAFGLFRKEAVVEAGGYRTDTVGEDMELIVRLHHQRRLAGKPCRVTFVPDPICWTEAPEDLRTLRRQRVRWQRGLVESLALHRGLLFHSKGGAVSWLAFPFMLVFEMLGPLVEVAGYVFMTIAFAAGILSWHAFAAFLLAAIGLGVLLSVNALLLEELSFHIYVRPVETVRLMTAALIENLGYRQLNSLWRLSGLVRALAGARGEWGEMRRRGMRA
jgi:cellulose synthase/poly-beta-1,6-N-acetylglucosamine synthase-like glycosyltransferase